MLAKHEEGEIRAGCRGNMRACWKVDITKRAKRNKLEPGSVCARTCLCMLALISTGVVTASWLVTLGFWRVCKYINKPAMHLQFAAATICYCPRECRKCMISTDVSSQLHNHVIKTAGMGECSPLSQLALALHYLTLIVLLAGCSCANGLPRAPTNSSLNGHFRTSVNFLF